MEDVQIPRTVEEKTRIWGPVVGEVDGRLVYRAGIMEAKSEGPSRAVLEPGTILNFMATQNSATQLTGMHLSAITVPRPRAPRDSFLLCPRPDAASLYAAFWSNPNSDTGVDVRFPDAFEIPEGTTCRVALGIRAACVGHDGFLDPYWLAPRSSWVKTGQVLTLRNAVGIIDAKFRDEIIACIHNAGPGVFKAQRGDSLLQLACGSLSPPTAAVVDETHPLFAAGAPKRGAGFGSTGSAGQAAASPHPAPKSDAAILNPVEAFQAAAIPTIPGAGARVTEVEADRKARIAEIEANRMSLEAQRINIKAQMAEIEAKLERALAQAKTIGYNG